MKIDWDDSRKSAIGNKVIAYRCHPDGQENTGEFAEKGETKKVEGDNIFVLFEKDSEALSTPKDKVCFFNPV